MNGSGLEGPLSAVLLGARGGIGQAFVDALTAAAAVDQVYATSRDEGWCAARPDDPKVTRVPLELTDEGRVERLADRKREGGVTPHVIVNCTGLLHADGLRPDPMVMRCM